MRKAVFSLLSGLICLSLSAASWAQENVPAAAKPADDGPSLADTMKFIQENLRSQDIRGVSYAYSNGDGKTPHNVQAVKEVSAAPATCTLEYTYTEKYGPGESVTFDHPWVASFRDVENVKVVNLSDQKRRNPTSDPPFFEVELSATKNVFKTRIGSDILTTAMDLYFRDEDTANRVAKAIMHAVELCKSKPDPRRDTKPESF